LPLVADKVDSAQLLFKQAEDAYFIQEDIRRTLSLYDRIIQTYPQSPYALKSHYARGWHFEYTLFDSAKAIDEYNALLEKHPDSQYAAMVKPKITAVMEKIAREKAVADSIAKAAADSLLTLSPDSLGQPLPSDSLRQSQRTDSLGQPLPPDSLSQPQLSDSLGQPQPSDSLKQPQLTNSRQPMPSDSLAGGLPEPKRVDAQQEPVVLSGKRATAAEENEPARGAPREPVPLDRPVQEDAEVDSTAKEK
jgi:hypothetical protein